MKVALNMKLAFQVFLLIFAFFLAVVAVGYFYQVTVTQDSKVPFLEAASGFWVKPGLTPTPTP